MFSNSFSSVDSTLSDAINNARLHNEALDRYNQMFGGRSNPILEHLKPSLVEARFQHLTNVVAHEKQQAEQLLTEVFRNNRT